MGLATLILAAYLVLIGFTVFAFVKKKWAIGIILSALMVTGFVILGLMWFMSPM